MYSWSLYLYRQIWHDSAVTNSQWLSTVRIALISLRTLYEGSLTLPYKKSLRILLFLVPGSSSQHCLFARPCSQHCSSTHNWTDLLHEPGNPWRISGLDPYPRFEAFVFVSDDCNRLGVGTTQGRGRAVWGVQAQIIHTTVKWFLD